MELELGISVGFGSSPARTRIRLLRSVVCKDVLVISASVLLNSGEGLSEVGLPLLFLLNEEVVFWINGNMDLHRAKQLEMRHASAFQEKLVHSDLSRFVASRTSKTNAIVDV
ncbi:hypothetical protein MUK42_33668 [Musa troglodytarum]|uniref:Uncharacterized protein n=1 Tax=Musa troglodytarum TaxID=320322 RepID=A0A9E7GFD4_9LILI|nr:hypothetical protein MUK42_33668 [Musa troglodytarum]